MSVHLQSNAWTYGTHEQTLSHLATPFIDAWDNFANQQLFSVSENGRIGWVPLTSKPGDHLFVLKGMRVPVVMRPVAGYPGIWNLVGASYIHGMMDGEGEDMAKTGCGFIRVY